MFTNPYADYAQPILTGDITLDPTDVDVNACFLNTAIHVGLTVTVAVVDAVTASITYDLTGNRVQHNAFVEAFDGMIDFDENDDEPDRSDVAFTYQLNF